MWSNTSTNFNQLIISLQHRQPVVFLSFCRCTALQGHTQQILMWGRLEVRGGGGGVEGKKKEPPWLLLRLWQLLSKRDANDRYYVVHLFFIFTLSVRSARDVRSACDACTACDVSFAHDMSFSVASLLTWVGQLGGTQWLRNKKTSTCVAQLITYVTNHSSVICPLD